MVDDKKNAQVEPTTEAKTEDVEAIKTQLAEAQAKLEEAQHEAKSHQEFGRKTKQELDRQRNLESEVASLKEELRGAVAELMDVIESRSEVDSEERPRKRKSEEYRERHQAPEIKPEQQRFMILGQEADRVLRDAGLQITDAEASVVYDLFKANQPDAGLREAIKLTEQKKTEATRKTQESETEKEAKRKQDIEEAARQLLEERGVLKTDTGAPMGSSGQVFTISEVLNMPRSEYQKHFPQGFPDVMKAKQEGRIKE